MHTEHVETVIVGGGQAGLAMSHHLRQLGQEHVMLERGRVAERWREHWDSLCFQGPNWNVRLPGFALQTDQPDAYATRDDIVRFIESYAGFINAPLRCGVTVNSLRQGPDSKQLVLETSAGRLHAKNVIIATGPFQKPAAPTPIESRAWQLHSSEYRNPDLLPSGAVLVIGSGNSGCQIAEELCAAGRRVYLSVSSYQGTPRRYRGKDCVWWLWNLGDVESTVDQRRPSRLMSGVGGGHDLDPRRLAADGVVLLGRVLGGVDGKLAIDSDLSEKLARGDDYAVNLMRRADDYATRHGLDLPAHNGCIAQLPEPKEVANPLFTLDLHAAGVTSIIWANGFRHDFNWIDLPVFADAGLSNRAPVQRRGITSVRGLYFVGLHWMHKFKSAFLAGVGEDAEHLAAHIAGDRG